MNVKLLLILRLCLIATLTYSVGANAKTYKWKDANGNIQYGDTPPTNVNVEAIELPKIMVVDNYAEQWKPLNFEQQSKLVKEKRTEAVKTNTQNSYKQLTFLAPKANQGIRANDGDVSAMISLKPKLKQGHFIQFSIDGNPSNKGKTRTANFSNLERGDHSISAKVLDSKGNVLKQSSVSFNVLRFSKLNNVDNKNLKQTIEKIQQARTYEEATKEFAVN